MRRYNDLASFLKSVRKLSHRLPVQLGPEYAGQDSILNRGQKWSNFWGVL